MTTEKKTINVKDGKVVDDNVKGGTKYDNMSLGAQDKVRVEFLVGRYAGSIEDVSEIKAKRMIALKKAKLAIGKELKTAYNEPKEEAEQSENKK